MDIRKIALGSAVVLSLLTISSVNEKSVQAKVITSKSNYKQI